MTHSFNKVASLSVASPGPTPSSVGSGGARYLAPSGYLICEASLHVAPPSVDLDSFAPQCPCPSAAHSVPLFGSRATKFTPCPACPTSRGVHLPPLFSTTNVPLRVPTRI